MKFKNLFTITGALLLSLVLGSGVGAYTIQYGDTLSSISKRFNVSISEVAQRNNIENIDRIFAGDEIDVGEYELPGFLDEGFGTTNPLPIDGYDSYITAPLSTTDSVVYVNELPSGITASIYTLYSSDGRTVREKISCSSTASSPSRLTGCSRGLSTTPNANGTIDETPGTGVTHSKNARIAITDTINFSGKALAILNGDQQTSSTAFIIGTGVSTTIRTYYKNAPTTSTSAFVGFTGGRLGWSDDGVNTFTFAQGGSGLTASSTKAIGITDSRIHLNVSSTSPLSFSPDNGSLYIKEGANSGIYQDANGIAVERYDTFDWYGNHTFNARTNVSSTFQSTQPLTVFSTTTSSTLPRVATDFISATSSGSNVTTTITNNLRVEGFVSSTQDFSRNLMATGQSSQAVNTTGNQVISHNLNFIPSLITIQAMARTDVTSFGGSYGTATSDLVDSVTYWGSDGANDTAGQVSNVIVSLRDGAGNIEATANLTAVTSNSFTLDWTTNSADGSSRFFQWAVYR